MAQGSSIGKIDKGLRQAVAMGERNQALLLRLYRWCEHLLIEDCSSGMVALYGLPTSVALSCPHAAGSFMAHNLEMNAQAFIVEQCVACRFHAERSPDNFGREVLARRAQQLHQAELAAQEHAARRAALQAEIDVLVEQEHRQGSVTAQSVLNLVRELQAEDDRPGKAATIREAAAVAPHFFSAAALNYLSLYLDGPAGPALLETLRRVLVAGRSLPAFVLAQVRAIISTGQHIDAATGVFSLAVAPAELPGQAPLITALLARLDYGYVLLRGEENQPTAYPNVIHLLQRLAAADLHACHALLTAQLHLPEKRDRIRVLELLRDLLAVAPALVLPLGEALVRSLDFEDDGYGESADHVARHTLALLYQHAPEPMMAVFNQMYPTLSGGGQVEVLTFYCDALEDGDLLLPTHAAALAGRLVADLAADAGPAEVREARRGLVAGAVCRAPALFAPHGAALVQVLLSVVREWHTLRGYRAELDQAAAPADTTNPLRGKDPWEIHALEMRQQNRVGEAERLVEHLLGADGSSLQESVLATLAGLSSDTDGFIKSRLLKILRDSTTAPERLSHLLPVIYASLFDEAARDVRWEALRFVEHLLDEHPACVPPSLLEAVKALLEELDEPIRGQAIRTYGSLIRRFAAEVEPVHLALVLAAINHPSGALHKAAAATASALVPFLTEAQKQLLQLGMQELERAYFDIPDFAYGRELADTLLRLARENQPLFLELAGRYLSKYATCGNFYPEQDALKRLTHLLPSFPELRPVWLPLALRYLQRVAPEKFSSDHLREELLQVLHQFSYAEVVAQQAVLVEFAHTQVQAGHFHDVFAICAVLGAQGLHAPVLALTQFLAQVVPVSKATEYVRRLTQTFAECSGLEAAVAAGQRDAAFLELLRPC